MSCIDKIDKIRHEILLERVTFGEARDFITNTAEEVVYVPPGYKLFSDCYLIGVPPIALGIKGSDLIIPIVRPRLGTSVISIKAEGEIRRLKEKSFGAP